MLAQRLRHRATIQQQVATVNGDGEPLGFAWTNFREDIPAEIVPLSGREFLAANAEQAETSARATIRFDPDITPDMRIVFDGLAYNILSVLPDPTYRRHLTLMLSKGLRDEPAQTLTIIDGGDATGPENDLIDGGAP